MHDTVWALYPEELWLNSPDNMHASERKLSQLLLARELGFTTPQTVVSSRWEFIEKRLDPSKRPIIAKMIRGIIADETAVKAFSTTKIDNSLIGRLRHAIPFPGIYQPFIEKAREWRVTVVGNRVFSAAIYTHATAKDDWRKHQTTSAVRFERATLPDDISAKCVAFLRHKKLKFGAFDLIEQPDGKIIFLECNSNGEFGWLENELGLPISEAIADELINITK